MSGERSVISILEVFEARRRVAGLPELESYSLADFEAQGLALFGGCHGCGESLAAYNAYPDRNGHWACRGCLREGYATVQAFEADVEVSE